MRHAPALWLLAVARVACTMDLYNSNNWALSDPNMQACYGLPSLFPCFESALPSPLPACPPAPCPPPPCPPTPCPPRPPGCRCNPPCWLVCRVECRYERPPVCRPPPGCCCRPPCRTPVCMNLFALNALCNGGKSDASFWMRCRPTPCPPCPPTSPCPPPPCMEICFPVNPSRCRPSPCPPRRRDPCCPIEVFECPPKPCRRRPICLDDIECVIPDGSCRPFSSGIDCFDFAAFGAFSGGSRHGGPSGGCCGRRSRHSRSCLCD